MLKSPDAGKLLTSRARFAVRKLLAFDQSFIKRDNIEDLSLLIIRSVSTHNNDRDDGDDRLALPRLLMKRTPNYATLLLLSRRETAITRLTLIFLFLLSRGGLHSAPVTSLAREKILSESI